MVSVNSHPITHLLPLNHIILISQTSTNLRAARMAADRQDPAPHTRGETEQGDGVVLAPPSGTSAEDRR